MSKIQMKINQKEINRLIKFNKMLETRTVHNLKNQMFKEAVQFRSGVIRSMKNTAKDYTRTYGVRGHHPSRPGYPPAIDTGNAIRTMQTRTTRTGAEYFIFGASYMEAHEFGVKHSWTIEAKNAKVLSDGVSFFGKKVEHPGLAERPFIRPLIEKSQRSWDKNFSRTVGYDIKRFSR